MTQYEITNEFTDDVWPDDWDEDDVEFLMRFIQAHFDARLLSDPASSERDYALLARQRERTRQNRALVPSDRDLIEPGDFEPSSALEQPGSGRGRRPDPDEDST